jgi:uncharacterized PurR-regulated membrane protein YhhQ (DUF165 family)
MKLAIAIYLLAMTAANISVSTFGPWISPINSFLFIGLDLTLRDWLHVKLKMSQMLLLILAGGVITYILNPTAGIIAIASASAFTASAIIDWVVFTKITGSWLKRANASNVAGAAVDSIAFPTIAFGVLLPHIIALQFAAKIAGGAVWAVLINKINKK